MLPSSSIMLLVCASRSWTHADRLSIAKFDANPSGVLTRHLITLVDPGIFLERHRQVLRRERQSRKHAPAPASQLRTLSRKARRFHRDTTAVVQWTSSICLKGS